jgi:hypothetical protein
VSLRSKLWVTVGLLCVSMAARAEYKEVWNPPEAKRDAQHMKRSKPVVATSKAGKAAQPGVHASHVKKPEAKHVTQSGSKLKAVGRTAAVKTAHAPVSREPSRKPVRARPAETAATQPAPTVDSHAAQATNGLASRELPPILH